MSLTMLQRPAPWDVVVIGSGAVGGWAALRLASRGLSVLVLEAGPDRYDADVRRSRPVERVARLADRLTGRRHVQSRIPSYWELNPDLFVLDEAHPYAAPADQPFDWIRSREVNGRLLTWGGIGVRASDYELLAARQDGYGEPWPFGYADLAPHYDEVDRFFTVYGELDGLPQLPDGRYAGAAALTAAERRFQHVVAERFPDRRVIASRGVLARASSRPAGEPAPPSPVRAAVEHNGAVLRADAVVSHVEVGADGLASGVAFYDRLTGRSHEVAARSVAVCASTLESTRILLNSVSAHHPAGLGGSSGALGRYLMDHPGVFVSGVAPGRRDEPWTDGAGGPKNVMVPRFQNLPNQPGGEFLRGYGIFGGIGRDRVGRGSDLAADEVPFTLVAFGEMLARPENRVTLDRERPDPWGIPTLRIECSFSANEHAMREHMLGSLTEMVAVAGGRVVGDPYLYSPGGFVHEVGTARMGTDPSSSVLNGYAQCWDAPNVYVMDGAAWPTSAWQNPTFTMMAVAGRACDHLAGELRQHRVPLGATSTS